MAESTKKETDTQDDIEKAVSAIPIIYVSSILSYFLPKNKRSTDTRWVNITSIPEDDESIFTIDSFLLGATPVITYEEDNKTILLYILDYDRRSGQVIGFINDTVDLTSDSLSGYIISVNIDELNDKIIASHDTYMLTWEDMWESTFALHVGNTLSSNPELNELYEYFRINSEVENIDKQIKYDKKTRKEPTYEDAVLEVKNILKEQGYSDARDIQLAGEQNILDIIRKTDEEFREQEKYAKKKGPLKKYRTRSKWMTVYNKISYGLQRDAYTYYLIEYEDVNLALTMKVNDKVIEVITFIAEQGADAAYGEGIYQGYRREVPEGILTKSLINILKTIPPPMIAEPPKSIIIDDSNEVKLVTGIDTRERDKDSKEIARAASVVRMMCMIVCTQKGLSSKQASDFCKKYEKEAVFEGITKDIALQKADIYKVYSDIESTVNELLDQGEFAIPPIELDRGPIEATSPAPVYSKEVDVVQAEEIIRTIQDILKVPKSNYSRDLFKKKMPNHLPLKYNFELLHYSVKNNRKAAEYLVSELMENGGLYAYIDEEIMKSNTESNPNVNYRVIIPFNLNFDPSGAFLLVNPNTSKTIHIDDLFNYLSSMPRSHDIYPVYVPDVQEPYRGLINRNTLKGAYQFTYLK